MLYNSKFYFLIALFATFSLLVACGDDEDESPDDPLIVGTWNYSSHDYTWEINGQEVISFLVENLEITQLQAQFTKAFIETQYMNLLGFEGVSFIFNADGTYSVREDGVEVESGTYNLQNNNSLLVMTSSERVREFDVEEYTNNRMVVSFSGEEQRDVTNDGVMENITFTLEATFVK